MEQIQKNNILRIYSKVKGYQVSVELPKNFNDQEVEIIIIPKQINFTLNSKTNQDNMEIDLLSMTQLKHAALEYADDHPIFPLNWSQNKLTREEMNER
ncbi:hypothetical protein GMMP15_1290004 [Candidatus Magnetomoraceae bacterium gMMP-15]